MKTFQLRDAVLTDSPTIARIYEHYVRTTCFTFEEVPPTPDEIGTRMNKIKEAGLPYCVAEGTDGSVIGYAYASSFHTRSAYRYSLENSVYKSGTALMEHLIRRCTARLSPDGRANRGQGEWHLGSVAHAAWLQACWEPVLHWVQIWPMGRCI
jgi:L-amino acid N-acyltransferase YncA